MSRCKSLRGLGLVLSLCLVCQIAMAAPKAVVEPVRINLGAIKQGAVAEASFTIRNEGDEPLEISKVQISCPCVIVDVPDPNIVKPGETATLPVRYDSKDKFGDNTATLSIALNDPQMPYAIVDIDVLVKALVTTNPDKVYEFGLAPRGYECRKILTIGAGEKNTDIEVLDLQLETPTMTAKAEKNLVKEYTRVQVKFALTADAPLGNYLNKLTARLRIGGEEIEVRMPVQGFVVGDVVVLPPAIHDPIKGYIQGEHISEITVRPSVNNTRCPKVLGALAVGPLKATVTPNPPENKYVISVDTADNAPGGPRSGTIYVMTESKDQPVVGVPVYFKVAKALDAQPENLVFALSGSPQPSPSAAPPTHWVSTSVWYKPWTWGSGNNVAAPENLLAQRVRVSNPQGKPFTIKEIRCEADLLKATIINPSSTAGAPAEIEVVPTGLIDPARAASMAILVTDCPGAEEFLIPVLLQP